MTELARRVRSCAAANRPGRAELSQAVSARATRRRAMRRDSRAGRPIYRENDNPFRGGRVALAQRVPETTAPTTERRAERRGDRRKNSRSGRRAADPHTNWRRLAWLFAAYAAFLSLRSLPLAMKNSVLDRVRDGIRRLFRREPIQPA